MENFVFIAGGIALLALAVLFVYLVLLVKRANTMMDKKVDPLLDDVKAMTESLKPAVAQIDPLMERVNLTMDAANLEIMRVDEILQDVTVIADKLAETTTTVNDIANAPLNAVNSMTSRLRGRFAGKAASATSAELAAKREADDADE